MPASRTLAIEMRMHAAAVLMLLVGVALVYGRVGGFGYAGFDDHGYVVYTEAVRAGLSLDGIRWAFTEFHMSNWHPLTWLSYMLDVSLFGLQPGPQHLVNVLFHALNSLLVYVFAVRILRHWFASLVVAWLFMAHPLHVESVAWIAERKDVLCGFFFLLSLLAYLRYVDRPTLSRYLCVAAAFALALMSKPMAVTLPLVLLILDYWPLQRTRGPARRALGVGVPGYVWLVVEKIPLLMLSFASGILTLLAQSTAMAPVENVPLDYRLSNAVLSWAIYLRDMLLPTRLAVLYPLRPIDFVTQLLPAMTVVVAVSALAAYWRKKYPWVLFGWLWLLVMLLPVIGLVQVGNQSHADRYMYLPSIGPFIVVGALLVGMGRTRLRRIAIGVVPAMLFYAAIAWVQVGYWSGPHMLFTRVLDVVGENRQSHLTLSVYFLGEGMLDDAERHARRAIEIDGGSSESYASLASVELLKKDFASAERLLRLALEIAPRDAHLLNKLGIALEEQGRLGEARRCFKAALESDPDLFQARENLERVGG